MPKTASLELLLHEIRWVNPEEGWKELQRLIEYQLSHGQKTSKHLSYYLRLIIMSARRNKDLRMAKEARAFRKPSTYSSIAEIIQG